MNDHELVEPEYDSPDAVLEGTTESTYGERTHIKSFVLRQARLTKAQERAYDQLGPQFIVPYNEQLLDFALIFGNDKPVVLEIGFGMGHATAEIAKANPDCNYIGVEVHKPGVGALLERIQAQNLTNIRIIHHDVVPVLQQMVAPGSISGVHVFFPDPWQKKRHYKRRLIQAPFLGELARICRAGAYLYLATDWEDYAWWMISELGKANDWQNQHTDFSPPIPWRPQTSFERKGLDKDHQIREIYALRKA